MNRIEARDRMSREMAVVLTGNRDWESTSEPERTLAGEFADHLLDAIEFPPAAPDLAEVRADVASLTDLPWCESYLATGVRHLQRNCDIDCPEHTDLATGMALADAARCEGPGRYDGAAIARLVNAVPALLVEIDRLNAQVNIQANA